MTAYEIQQSKTFETTIFVIIGINSLLMIADDPMNENSELIILAEKIFTVLYTLEMIIKVLGLGFILGKNAYLKDSWNILDFIIVISSYP